MESTLLAIVDILLITILLASEYFVVESVPFLAPRSATVIVNDTFEFNCNSSSKNVSRLDWQFIRNISLIDSLYSNDSFCIAGETSPECAEITSYGELKKYSVNAFKFRENTRNGFKESFLSVLKANLQQAGVYRCSEGFGEVPYSFLNVIDPTPRCNESSYNIVNDEIMIVCYFYYFGVTANLQWSYGVFNMTNNCTDERTRIACDISVTGLSISNDSCDLPQCVDKDQSLELIIGNMSVTCTWGSYQTLESQSDEYTYMFYLDSRPVAYIRCFEFANPLKDEMTTLGSSGTTNVIIALAVTCLAALMFVMTIVLLRKGKCCRRADVPTSVPPSTNTGIGDASCQPYISDEDAMSSIYMELTEKDKQSSVYETIKDPRSTVDPSPSSTKF